MHRFVKKLNPDISKKQFKFTLAPEEVRARALNTNVSTFPSLVLRKRDAHVL